MYTELQDALEELRRLINDELGIYTHPLQSFHLGKALSSLDYVEFQIAEARRS